MLKERCIFPSGEVTSFFGDEQEKRKINNVQFTINNWNFLMILFLTFFILSEEIRGDKNNMICKNKIRNDDFFAKNDLNFIWFNSQYPILISKKKYFYFSFVLHK